MIAKLDTDQLGDWFSDWYKEFYGFRPRHVNFTDRDAIIEALKELKDLDDEK